MRSALVRSTYSSVKLAGFVSESGVLLDFSKLPSAVLTPDNTLGAGNEVVVYFCSSSVKAS